MLNDGNELRREEARNEEFARSWLARGTFPEFPDPEERRVSAVLPCSPYQQKRAQLDAV